MDVSHCDSIEIQREEENFKCCEGHRCSINSDSINSKKEALYLLLKEMDGFLYDEGNKLEPLVDIIVPQSISYTLFAILFILYYLLK